MGMSLARLHLQVLCQSVIVDLPFSENVTALAELESVTLGVDIVPDDMLDNDLYIA